MLSAEVCARCVVRPEGLEPPTTGFEVRCSIQLSYGRVARILVQAPAAVNRPAAWRRLCNLGPRAAGAAAPHRVAGFGAARRGLP